MLADIIAYTGWIVILVTIAAVAIIRLDLWGGK